ncbi:MAG: GNAT family N-acetyltransferase [Clostridia bacterium]|nr:GNAT family N-acetyltransferase [Clostridia bacterium]
MNDKECYFNTFYVKRNYRNKGIGNKIFDICMNYIISNGYKKITLSIDPKFEIAKKIYEKKWFCF